MRKKARKVEMPALRLLLPKEPGRMADGKL